MSRRISRRSRAISPRPSQYSQRGDAACEAVDGNSGTSPINATRKSTSPAGSFVAFLGRKACLHAGFEVRDVALAFLRVERIVRAGAERGRVVERPVGTEQLDKPIVDRDRSFQA